MNKEIPSSSPPRTGHPAPLPRFNSDAATEGLGLFSGRRTAPWRAQPCECTRHGQAQTSGRAQNECQTQHQRRARVNTSSGRRRAFNQSATRGASKRHQTSVVSPRKTQHLQWALGCGNMSLPRLSSPREMSPGDGDVRGRDHRPFGYTTVM